MTSNPVHPGQILVLMDQALLLLDGGQSLNIEQWFDEDGEDCGPGDAVSCVAGPDSENNWMAVDLMALQDVSEH